MEKFGEFFVEFMKPFFKTLVDIIEYIIMGILKMFNIVNYISIIKEYSKWFRGFDWILVIFTVLCLLGIIGLIVWGIYFLIKRRIKYRKNLHKQESLLDEVEKLNNDVIRLKKENEKFLELSGEVEYDENGNIINKTPEGESRFFRLTRIDKEMENYVPRQMDDNITLEQFCNSFKNYAANELKLYYSIDLIRLFVAAFASNRLIILQGISGTGKTSLAYAIGQFLDNPSTIVSVQPSYRDRSELFGYFNEFTKRFNETELLEKMYEASYKPDIYISILDEMNIARVEYYFAEMLSILEMPRADEWIINLVLTEWPNDPKKIVRGRFKIPNNMWYVGTINNDDSTFMITDKVYDRAMPINIDDKVDPFEAPKTGKVHISSAYFISLFEKAYREHPLSVDVLNKIKDMDDYLIKNFRISFGNRIARQMQEYVPAFVACGGQEITAVDYLIANKILRKLEQLNLSYIRDELDGLISFLDKTFGKDAMVECKSYLQRLKKMA
jgi:hypothetical protein